MRANLKRHNRVYTLSSKHTYRPMRARVVAPLFYKVVDKSDTISQSSGVHIHFFVKNGKLGFHAYCYQFARSPA